MRILLGLFLMPLLPVTQAAQQAFPPTPPGVNETKTLPAGLLLRTQSHQNYFSSSNRLFRPLFRYISRHDIAMTTPVEATIAPGAMYFWIAPDEQAKVSGQTDEVEVISFPLRLVASRGARGSYSQKNYETTLAELLAWLDSRPDLQAAGPPTAVFWHGPFTPWFAKQFEVHLPLAPPPAD